MSETDVLKRMLESAVKENKNLLTETVRVKYLLLIIIDKAKDFEKALKDG